MGTFFQEMEEGETLEKFLDRHVRPNTEFLENCGKVIDTVVKLVHKHPHYSIKQVVKGGSLGKGTGVRGQSDVDLLVVLNNFDSVDKLKANMNDIIYSFENYLLSANTVSIEDDESEDDEDGNLQIRILGTTPFTLQFQVLCTSARCWFDVDLLPIIDVWSVWFLPDFCGGQTAGLEDTYQKMQDDKSLRKYFAKCLANIQVDFVKLIPAKAKDLIRLLKYWKNTENVDMTSYCVELIVIYIWRKQGSPENFKMKTMMTEVVKLLSNYDEIAVSFDDHYQPEKYISLLNKTPPYILDPANPFHDVSSDSEWSWASFRKDCSRIGRKGKELRRKLEALPEDGQSIVSEIVTIGLGLALNYAMKKLAENQGTNQ